MITLLAKARNGNQIPLKVVLEVVLSYQCGCCDLNLGLEQESYTLLTTKPSLQPLDLVFVCLFGWLFGWLVGLVWLVGFCFVLVNIVLLDFLL